MFLTEIKCLLEDKFWISFKSSGHARSTPPQKRTHWEVKYFCYSMHTLINPCSSRELKWGTLRRTCQYVVIMYFLWKSRCEKGFYTFLLPADHYALPYTMLLHASFLLRRQKCSEKWSCTYRMFFGCFQLLNIKHTEMVWLFPGIIHSCNAAELRQTLMSIGSFKAVLCKVKWNKGRIWNVHICTADDPSYYVGHIFAEYPPLNETRPAIRKFFTKIFHSHFSSAPFSTFMWEQAQDQFFATSISRLFRHTLSVKLMLGQIWARVCLGECVSCGYKALGTHYWIKSTMKSREEATKGFCPN